MAAADDPDDIQTNERLPQDGDPPFSPPADGSGSLGEDHQLQDNRSNIDPTEFYNEGSAAAELDQPASNIDPHDGSVADYDPPRPE